MQLNVPHSPTHSYIHLSNLSTALELDPDLASLPVAASAIFFKCSLYVLAVIMYLIFMAMEKLHF